MAESGSEIELRPRHQDMKTQTEVDTEGSVYQGKGIIVKTNVDVTVEPDRTEIEEVERERLKTLSERRVAIGMAT